MLSKTVKNINLKWANQKLSFDFTVKNSIELIFY